MDPPIEETDTSPNGFAVARATSRLPTTSAISQQYVDRILDDCHFREQRQNDRSVLIASNQYPGSSTLAYFSEKRITALTKILGHSRVEEILSSIDNSVTTHLEGSGNPISASTVMSSSVSASEYLFQHASLYIKAYFDEVHPIYPFLNRAAFEAMAFDPGLRVTLAAGKAWSALYHAVLGLGCLHCGGGSFLPAKGHAWKFFKISLGLLPDILSGKRTLVTAQAMTAMAVFATNYSSLHVEELPVIEAARVALVLGLGKRFKSGESEVDRSCTFWIIYCLEKEYAFNVTRCSVINDCDIGCPLPPNENQPLRELDWLRTWASHCRIMTSAYDSLFSVSATLNSTEVYLEEIDHVYQRLNRWRDCIPEDFRPGLPIRPHKLGNRLLTSLALRIHLMYYNILVAISRLALHVEDKPSDRHSRSKITLMEAARSIIDATQFIVFEPFTSTWIMGHMPLAATFVLFDFVVHNPTHPETRKNLSFLDVSAGYFSRMEMATDGYVAGSTMAEFSHIARQHVSALQASGNRHSQGAGGNVSGGGGGGEDGGGDRSRSGDGGGSEGPFIKDKNSGIVVGDTSSGNGQDKQTQETMGNEMGLQNEAIWGHDSLMGSSEYYPSNTHHFHSAEDADTLIYPTDSTSMFFDGGEFLDFNVANFFGPSNM
ncbi:hypothetical protein DL98DRAFT_662226 [Cadophora sp. DSE1049]|nr:hypothetical protein DL98DRAFT_662226 [Cadophora sp. DSE1049]